MGGFGENFLGLDLQQLPEPSKVLIEAKVKPNKRKGRNKIDTMQTALTIELADQPSDERAQS